MDKQKYVYERNEFSGFNKHNGIEIVAYDNDSCTVVGKLSERTMNPLEITHGGFVYSLCDVAAGVAACCDGHPGVTLSSSMHFLHPSKGTMLRAEGKVIKRGRTVSVVETSVYDDQDRLTTYGTFDIYAL